MGKGIDFWPRRNWKFLTYTALFWTENLDLWSRSLSTDFNWFAVLTGYVHRAICTGK